MQGNKVLPGVMDHYLGRTNYQAQQTDQPVDPDRADNLWDPVAGDHGARGSFDARSHAFSPQLWATMHRTTLALGLAGVAGLLCAAWWERHTS